MSKRNSLRRYAAGLAAVLVLTGCQAEAAPGPEPTNATATHPGESPTPPPTGSATSTSTAAPTATGGTQPIPGLPEAAKHRTHEGAIAFVTHYFERLNEVYQQPKTGLLEPFGTKACKSCDAFAEMVAKLVRSGDRFTADRVDKVLIQGFGENLPTDPRYTVSAQMESTGAKVENVASGRVVQTDKRRSQWLAVHLVWVDGGWRIDSMQGVDDGRGADR